MTRHHFFFCLLRSALGLALALGLFLRPASAHAQQPAAKGPVSFINDVAPILKENCFACHDSKKRKGKLDMSTYESIRKGGSKEDPIVPGKPEESHLLEVLRAKDNSRMPPAKDGGEALPKEKIAIIERWVADGAKLDSGLTPKSELMRELRVRWKPPAPPVSYKFPVTITALAFTPDGKKLVVGGHHELTIWDATLAKLEKRIYTRAERAYAMVFLPDGTLAVAGGRPGEEGDVCIYNLQPPGKVENGIAVLDGVNDKTVLIKALHDSDDAVLCLAVSADGKRIAAGGCDRIVNVWSLAGGPAAAKLEQTIENHADWVFGIAFTPDGKHLLTCSRDKTAKVWDLTTKESVLTFPDHQNSVYAVAVKPDGKVGISVGEDNQIRFWNATGEGKQIRNAGGHGKAIFRVVQHPKQPLLATCSGDNTVRLWNADNGQNTKTLYGHTDWVYALSLSPDGNLLASGSWNGEVKLWKIADGSVVKAFNGSPGLVTASAVAQPKK